MIDAAALTTTPMMHLQVVKWNETEMIGRNASHDGTARDATGSRANLKTFFMQKLYGDKTGYHKEYNPVTGIRIALVLGALLLFVFLRSMCKMWCRRHRWSSEDKYYLQYCKAKHQAAVGSVNSSYHRDSFTRRLSIARPDPAVMEATARWIQSQPLNDKSCRDFCKVCSLSCIDCHKVALCSFEQMQYSVTTSSLGVSMVAGGSASQQELGELRNVNVARNYYDSSEYSKEHSCTNSPKKYSKKDTFQTKSVTEVTPQDLLFNGYCLEVCSFIDKKHTMTPVPKVKHDSVSVTEKEPPSRSNLCLDTPVISEVSDKYEEFSSLSLNSMWNPSSLQQSLYNQDGTYDLSGSMNAQIDNSTTTSSKEQTKALIQSMPYLKPQEAYHFPHDLHTDMSRCVKPGQYPSLSISTGQISSTTHDENKFPFSQAVATSCPGEAPIQKQASS